MKIEQVTVPEGRSGNWRVERFEITKDFAKIFNMRELFGGRRRVVYPGTYTRLLRYGTVVMSDTPAERRDLIHLVFHAKGEGLMNGLGLGVAVQAVLKKPEVTHVTVVEISEDVIKLVGDHYLDMFPGRLTIVNADALEYKAEKGKRFNWCWHDIWDTICLDNLETMSKLHRKYGRRADWQWSWCRDQIKRLQRKENRQNAGWW